MGTVAGERGPDTAATESWWGGRARLLSVRAWIDARGCLVDFDYRALPFQPRRTFVIRDVPAGTTRGGHAHARAHQLLVCLAGTVVVELRHGGDVQQVELSDAGRGLLMMAGIWARQRYSVADTVLMVMASEPYDAGGYLPEPT